MTDWPEVESRIDWMEMPGYAFIGQILFPYLWLPSWVLEHKLDVVLGLCGLCLLVGTAYIAIINGLIWLGVIASLLSIALPMLAKRLLLHLGLARKQPETHARPRCYRILRERIVPEKSLKYRIKKWISSPNPRGQKVKQGTSNVRVEDKTKQEKSTLRSIIYHVHLESIMVLVRGSQVFFALLALCLNAYLYMKPTHQIPDDRQISYSMAVVPALILSIANLVLIPITWAGASDWAIVPNPFMRRRLSYWTELFVILFSISAVFSASLLTMHGDEGQMEIGRDYRNVMIAWVGILGFNLYVYLNPLSPPIHI